MEKLKPCKCGKKPEVFETQHGIWNGCGIGCTNIDCEMGLIIKNSVISGKRARAKAVAAWNRRAGE